MKKLIIIFSIIFLFTITSFSQVVKLTEFGAVPDDNQPDDTALVAAVNSLARTGGTIEFPCGTLNLSRELNFSERSNWVNWKLVGNECSVIQIKGAWILFSFGNSPQVTVDGLTFMGTPLRENDPYFSDAVQGVLQMSAYQNIIKNTKFIGIRSENFIVQTNGNTIISDCQFDGNSTMGANVLASGMWQKGLTVLRTTFVDYSNFKGMYVSKTPYGNMAWIKVTGGIEPGNATAQRALRVQDCIFDEGSYVGVHADNIFAVDISNSNFNVNGTLNGKGIYLDNVKKAKLSGNWLGYAGERRPAIIALNNSTVMVEDLTLGNQVYMGEADTSSRIDFDTRTCESCVLIRR